jgi:hypothetical protein
MSLSLAVPPADVWSSAGDKILGAFVALGFAVLGFVLEVSSARRQQLI